MDFFSPLDDAQLQFSVRNVKLRLVICRYYPLRPIRQYHLAFFQWKTTSFTIFALSGSIRNLFFIIVSFIARRGEHDPPLPNWTSYPDSRGDRSWYLHSTRTCISLPIQ